MTQKLQEITFFVNFTTTVLPVNAVLPATHAVRCWILLKLFLSVIDEFLRNHYCPGVCMWVPGLPIWILYCSHAIEKNPQFQFFLENSHFLSNKKPQKKYFNIFYTFFCEFWPGISPRDVDLILATQIIYKRLCH